MFGIFHHLKFVIGYFGFLKFILLYLSALNKLIKNDTNFIFCVIQSKKNRKLRKYV